MLLKYILILLGATGIFFGFANPVLELPLVVLLYPFSLYLLALTDKNYVRNSIFTGTLGYGVAFYWLAKTAHVYGLIPYVLAVFFPLLLGFYFSLYGLLISYYVHNMARALPFYRIFGAGFLWYFTELFRGWFLTGFPWFTVSSAFAPLPELIQLAGNIGAYGLSALFVMIGFFFAECYLSLTGKNTYGKFLLFFVRVGGIILLGTIYFYGTIILKDSDNTFSEATIKTHVLHEDVKIPYKTVHEIPAIIGQAVHRILDYTGQDSQLPDRVYFTIVQGNISQNVKWSPLFQEDSLKKFFRLTEEAEKFLPKLSMFVYPETAFPITAYHYPDLFDKILTVGKNKTMLFGIPSYKKSLSNDETAEGNYYNTIASVQDGKFVAEYAKEHLVPFGEYVPPLPLPDVFNKMLARYGGAYSVGQNDKVMLTATMGEKKVVLLPLICYEAVFPELSFEKLRKTPAHVLLNVSNDAWYDKSSAPRQHLNLALLRTVESGLPMIRASNTGISVFIDRYGRIILESELFSDETLSVPLEIKPVTLYEPTFFVRFAPYLPFVALLLFGFLQFLAVLNIQKKMCVKYN